MLTISPALGLLPAIKVAFGLATPFLLGFAGVLLIRKRLVFGLCLLLAALLILIGIAAPLLLSDALLPSALGMITLACNGGWFVAGLALVFLGIGHRANGPLRISSEP